MTFKVMTLDETTEGESVKKGEKKTEAWDICTKRLGEEEQPAKETRKWRSRKIQSVALRSQVGKRHLGGDSD